MDLEEIISEEKSALEKAKVLEELLQRKNESFIKLKKKIIATSSVLSIYKEMKNECDYLKRENLNLRNKNDESTSHYKELLIQKLDYDKSINHLKSQYDDISNKYIALVEQDNGKAATIKQLQYFITDLKNKLDGKEIEIEMVKTKSKEDIEKYKLKHKSFKDCEDLPEPKVQRNKLLRIFSYIKALRKELDKMSIPESKTINNIFKELNKLKSFKKPSTSNLSIEMLEEFDEDEMPFNSPASADTGKGSSIYASDDEKSVSALTTPNEECLSVASLYSRSSILSPSNKNNSPCMSGLSSPVRSESYLLSQYNRVDKASSPIKFQSPKKRSESEKHDMTGSCKMKSDNCNQQLNHVEKQDEEYINYILEKMTRPAPVVSPLHIDHSDSIKTDRSIIANKHPEISPKVRLKKNISKRKKITSKYLLTMVKQLVQIEINKLSTVRIRRRPFSNITNEKKGIEKLHSNSIKRRIKLESNKPINRKPIKVNLLKKSKCIRKIRPSNEKTCNYINIKNKVEPIPTDLNEEISLKRKLLPSVNISQNQIDVENERKISEAKKILTQCTLQNEIKNKMSIKWRVGSELQEKTLKRNEDMEKDVIIPNLPKNNQSPQKSNDKSKAIASVQRSKRKKISLVQNEENVLNLTNQAEDDPINDDFMNVDDTDINVYNTCDVDENNLYNSEKIKVDEPVEDVLPVINSYYFKSLLSISIQNMKKKHRMQNTASSKCCEKYETFLSSEFTTEDMDNFLIKNNEESEEKIASAIVEFLSSPLRYTDVTVQHHPLLPMTRSHQAALVLINKMVSSPRPKTNVPELVMKGIEYKIFKLNKTPPLPSLLNLTPFYVAMCRLNKQKDRLKLFCMDALYCLSFSAIPIIYLILQTWPALFPKSSNLSSNDPLFLTMVHFLLSNFSEKVEYKSKQLQKLLENKYGFKTGQYNDDEILRMLVDSIKAGKKGQHRNIEAAFLLLGKKTGVDWCHKNIVTKTLLPLIDDPQSNSFIKIMAIKMIGPLSRPFSHKILECGVLYEKLVKLFKNAGDHQMDEAILSSVLYFNIKNDNFVEALMQWKPTYSITPKITELLEKFIHGKPKDYWASVLKKDTS